MIEQNTFDNLISELNLDIVFGTSIAEKIQNSPLYVWSEPKGKLGTGYFTIGEFNKKNAIFNQNIKWGDFRIFDKYGNELINLANYII